MNLDTSTLEVGDLIFYEGDSIISKIINMVDGKFSHVAVYIGNDVVIEAQRFTKTRIHTVHQEASKITVMKLNLNDLQKERLIQSLHLLEGIPYDYSQILSILLNKLFGIHRFNNPKKMICSEYVAHVLLLLGYVNNLEYNNMIGLTPNECYDYIKYIVNHNS